MKKLFIFALLFVALGAAAQPTVYTLKKRFADQDVSIDTVTSTATNYLGNLIPISGARGTVTVIVTITKVSGTVGGTMTLQGSYDGTTFVALNAAESQTALATKVQADATATYHWWLKGNPFPYYRVSTVGAGTMVAKQAAIIVAH